MFPLLFRCPHHFSVQTVMFLSHAVPGHSAFLSSLIFPCRIVFASPVLVTWTNHPNFHLLTAYLGSRDPITSASSSLMALLVLFTVFDICVILQRHLNSEILIPYSAAVVLTETTENTAILISPDWTCFRCSYLSRFWQNWEICHHGSDSTFLFLFKSITPPSPNQTSHWCSPPLINLCLDTTVATTLIALTFASFGAVLLPSALYSLWRRDHSKAEVTDYPTSRCRRS